MTRRRPLPLGQVLCRAFLILATCLLSISIFSKRGLKFRGYARLISTKIKWKQTLRSGINLNSQKTTKPDQSFLNKGTCKVIRNLLIQNKFRNPLGSSKLCRLGKEYDKLKAIYLLPFNVTKETKLSMFQYKIIHNILPYGNRLYMMKILNSPLCNYCNLL